MVYYNSRSNKQPMKNYINALHTTETAYLPAGRYWVGDPCYAIRTDWDEFIEDTYENGVIEFKGQEVFVINTGGDGSWNHNGETYFVDAGLLAVVPADLVEEYGNDKGAFIELADDAEVGCITNNYGGLHEVFAGDIAITWIEVEDEAVAEFAYENADYSVITTDELFAELMTYLNDTADEAEIEEAREALPQFA